MGLFNGGGRIGWASFSDYIGRPNMFTIFFSIQIVAYFLLPGITNAFLFQAVIFLILSCYGGGFATIPAYIGDMFGTRQLGAIHGYILTAWAAAGVAGPLFAAWTRTVSSNYNFTLYFFAGLLVVALVVSFLIRNEITKLRAKKAQEAIKLAPELELVS
jgi:OFA family oxalate/formate antiporter-like MFS transporter